MYCYLDRFFITFKWVCHDQIINVFTRIDGIHKPFFDKMWVLVITLWNCCWIFYFRRDGSYWWWALFNVLRNFYLYTPLFVLIKGVCMCVFLSVYVCVFMSQHVLVELQINSSCRNHCSFYYLYRSHFKRSFIVFTIKKTIDWSIGLIPYA